MSEKKDNASYQSPYQQQKANKPLLDDFICKILDGDMQKRALDFVAYLCDNKMKPAWTLTNEWTSACKSKAICNIVLVHDELNKTIDRLAKIWGDRRWRVKLHLNHINLYEEQIISAGLQGFVLDNVGYCRNCKGSQNTDRSCRKQIMVLGKEIKNFCCWPLIWAYDPDDEAVESIKKLLELEKQARAGK